MKRIHNLSALLVTLNLCIAGCTEPVVAPYEDAPAPTGVIEGSILYIGPAPVCEDQVPAGQVILTLFEYDNPPPPSGRALAPINLLSMKASSLFSSEDCELPTDSPSFYVQRSVSFTWPRSSNMPA